MGKPREGTQRVNLFLNPEIVKAVKMRSIAEGMSLSKLVDKALLGYLSGAGLDINSIPPTPSEK